MFLLLALVPIAELFLMVAVFRALSDEYGWEVALGFTLGAIVGTGLVGALLARKQGVVAVRSLRATLDRGEFPGRALLDTAMIVLGGAMLLMPGYLTDALGVTLLFPPTRRLWRDGFERWLRRRAERGEVRFYADPRAGSPPPGGPRQGGEVIIEETFAPAPEDDRPGPGELPPR